MPEFHGPSLPPKTVLKNMSEEFLEKRRKALDSYLQVSLQFTHIIGNVKKIKSCNFWKLLLLSKNFK